MTKNTHSGPALFSTQLAIDQLEYGKNADWLIIWEDWGLRQVSPWCNSVTLEPYCEERNQISIQTRPHPCELTQLRSRLARSSKQSPQRLFAQTPCLLCHPHTPAQPPPGQTLMLRCENIPSVRRIPWPQEEVSRGGLQTEYDYYSRSSIALVISQRMSSTKN